MPLFFGERTKFKFARQDSIKSSASGDKAEEIEIDPYERFIKLLQNSLSFICLGNSKREMTAAKVV